MGSGQAKEIVNKKGNYFDIRIVVDKKLEPKLLKNGSVQLDELKEVGREYGIFEIGFMIGSKVIEIQILEIPEEKFENEKLFEVLENFKLISEGRKKYNVKSIEIEIYKNNYLEYHK